MKKQRVWLAQVNHRYGENVFLPYSAGLLQAYAQADPVLADEYDFAGFTYTREPVPDAVARVGAVNVFAASIYIWNASYSLALAKAVKEANPDCLVVVGGPHVPQRIEGYFDTHPYLDVVINYEGEAAFAQVLRHKLMGREQRHVVVTTDRIADLATVPSPYLVGVFDELMKLPLAWHATFETDRGCPFFCQFCDWGSAVYTKLRKFPYGRLVDEIDWFAHHKIDLLYGADANFAMYDAHVDLARELVRAKERHGYPRKFRVAYAKNSGDRVFEVSKTLNDAGMSKGTTLSFQSMDQTTLENVKRNNIKIDNFKQLIGRYRAADIPTYTELIIGLPGETYDSFADGVTTLLDAGAHDGLAVYTCELLPNSEMSAPAYRKKHGIQSVHTPVMFYHGTPSTDPHQEFYELVVATKTLPPDDWLKCQLFAAFVQAFHCLGLTQCVAVFLRHHKGVSYRTFYEKLIDYAAHSPLGSGPLGFVHTAAECCFLALRSGKDWGWTDAPRWRFGNLIWPVEEGIFLHCVAERADFYAELGAFLLAAFPDLGRSLATDLVLYQMGVIKAPPLAGEREARLLLCHNLDAYLACCYAGLTPTLKAGNYDYRVPLPLVWPDLKAYAREVVWYGRKGGKFLLLDKVEEVRDG